MGGNCSNKSTLYSNLELNIFGIRHGQTMTLIHSCCRDSYRGFNFFFSGLIVLAFGVFKLQRRVF